MINPESKPECPLKIRATELAIQRSLLEEGQKLKCPHEDGCDQIAAECGWAKDPQTLTIYIEQSGKFEIPSNLQRFMDRLKKWDQIRNTQQENS